MPWDTEVSEQTDSPCETCRVVLRPENKKIIDVWRRCADDWIMSGGMESIQIGISGPAIETALNVSKIENGKDRKFIFDKVKKIGQILAKEISEERKKNRDADAS